VLANDPQLKGRLTNRAISPEDIVLGSDRASFILHIGCDNGDLRLNLLRSDATGARRNNEMVSRTLTVCVGKTSGSSSSTAITSYPPGRKTTFTQPSFFSLNVL
jgi:hypothetical protein